MLFNLYKEYFYVLFIFQLLLIVTDFLYISQIDMFWVMKIQDNLKKLLSVPFAMVIEGKD